MDFLHKTQTAYVHHCTNSTKMRYIRRKKDFMSNKVTIIGRIATNLVLQEVDVHGTKTKVCNFRVAVDDPHQGTLPNGAASVQFFKVAVWRNNAVALVKHMVKGNLIAITGTVVHSQFKGNNGTIFNNLEIKNPEVLFLPLLIHAYNQGYKAGRINGYSDADWLQDEMSHEWDAEMEFYAGGPDEFY